MSKQRCLILALTMTALCSWSPKTMAQFGGQRIDRPLDSPTFSPYLNLLRNNNSGPGMNYYGLVRPQQEFALQNQQLGQGLQNLQMQGSSMPMYSGGYGYSQLGVTGHPVIFNSFGTSHFSGGYTGFGGGGFGGGGGYGGGYGSNTGSFGGQAGSGGGGMMGSGMMGGGFGGMSNGYGGVSGHPSQFGGIGNTYRPGR